MCEIPVQVLGAAECNYKTSIKHSNESPILPFHTSWTLLLWSSSASKVLIKCTVGTWKMCFSYLHISGETKQMGKRHLWNIQHLLPSRTTTGCFKFLIDLLFAHIMMYERLTMYENIYQSTVNLWRKNRATSIGHSFASEQMWIIAFKTSHVLQHFSVSILKTICGL